MALTIKYFVPSDQLMSRMETLQIEVDTILRRFQTFLDRKYRGYSSSYLFIQIVDLSNRTISKKEWAANDGDQILILTPLLGGN